MLRAFTFLLAPCFVLVFTFLATAQTGTVRGFVYEQRTGEPCMFFPVCLVGTSFNATTDENGYFCMPKVPAGKYSVCIVHLGFDTLTMELELRSGQILTEKLFLMETIALSPAEMTLDEQEMERRTRAAVKRLTPEMLEQIPVVPR